MDQDLNDQIRHITAKGNSVTLPTECCLSCRSRLVGYLECGRAVIGGRYDKADRWVDPTVLVDVARDSKVMKEEIFGPILPIINVENHVDAINFIRER